MLILSCENKNVDIGAFIPCSFRTRFYAQVRVVHVLVLVLSDMPLLAAAKLKQ